MARLASTHTACLLAGRLESSNTYAGSEAIWGIPNWKWKSLSRTSWSAGWVGCTQNCASGIEKDHEAQIFGQGINFFHIENWYSIHSVIRTTLKLMGLYWRGRRNADQIQIRHNYISMNPLPSRFDGFTLLHISDLHVEMSDGAMRRLAELLPEMIYDVCVLTGDYRSATFGPFDAALKGLARVRPHLKTQSTGY